MPSTRSPWRRFRHTHWRVTGAAEVLVRERPWRFDDEQAQLVVCRRFCWRASHAYGIAMPEVTFDPAAGDRNGYYQRFGRRIALPYFSAVTLFHEFRHHWQWETGMAPAAPRGRLEDDANAWAYSLLFDVAPRRFRRMARAGRLVNLTPREVASL